VGRPRADRRRLERPPREEILFQAARLFAARGVSATTTRAIASAAGLRQPSLFHWFPSKEAILAELLDSALAPSLAFAEQEAASRDRAAVRLFRVVRFDARHLAAYPFELGAVLSPEARAPRFRRFWRGRARLLAIVEQAVAAGSRGGELVGPAPAVASRAIFGMVEASVTWARQVGRTPDEVGDALARLALRALLREPATLDEVARAAAARQT
jgi:AcrR family transcriptional regulator